MIPFYCVCKAHLKGEPGTKVRCPRCGQKLLVPGVKGNQTVLGTPEPVALPPPPPGRYCPHCGRAIHDQAVVCVHCGASARPPRIHRLAAECPHGIHAVLTVFTCGLWAPLWLVHWLIVRDRG